MLKEKLFVPYFIIVCLFNILFKFYNNNITQLIFAIFNLLIAAILLIDKKRMV